MSTLLIRGGRVISPEDSLDATIDVRVENGVIQQIGADLPAADETVDASGQIVSPGFVDIHVHLREPGGEASETFATALAAAVAGGFTSVCAMPNTQPVNDRAELTRSIIEKTSRLGLSHVFPVAAVSMGSQGESLTDFAGLKASGAVAFTDDGKPIKTAGLVRRAMLQARELGMPVIEHCEDASLSVGGVMNEGDAAKTLRMKGISPCSEEVCLARDMILAEATGAHLHAAHLSTARAIDLVRMAKRRGVRVTCEVMPHHFVLTDEAVLKYGTNAKMNPPLRGAGDVEAAVNGIADGTVDVIATDHAPHAPELKAKPLDQAPFGIIGLETALGLAMTHLVHTGKISLWHLITLLTVNPARVISRPLGRLQVGGPADITVFDPGREWTYSVAEGRSKSRNTPFDGWTLRGKVTHTIVAGKVVYTGR